MTVEITTDVLIIGTGPAGSTCAALLATYGIECLAINRYRWLANTPRAHITNQRTMEVLRDLGREVEDEAMMHAAHQELMGANVFCTSLAGEEIGRMEAWGTAPELARGAPTLLALLHERSAPNLYGADPLQDRCLTGRADAHVHRVPEPHAGQ